LKSLDDAVRLRRKILLAMNVPRSKPIRNAGPNDDDRRRWAASHRGRTRRHVFRAGGARCWIVISITSIRGQARIILVEGASGFCCISRGNLSASAHRQLTKLGVEVRLNTKVPRS